MRIPNQCNALKTALWDWVAKGTVLIWKVLEGISQRKWHWSKETKFARGQQDEATSIVRSFLINPVPINRFLNMPNSCDTIATSNSIWSVKILQKLFSSREYIYENDKKLYCICKFWTDKRENSQTLPLISSRVVECRVVLSFFHPFLNVL